MRRFSLLVVLLVIGFAAPVWADNITLSPGASITNPVAHGGQGGKGGDGGTGVGIGVGKGGDGGNASAGAISGSTSGAAAVSGSHSGALSGSASGAQASAPSSIDIRTEIPRQAPPAIAPNMAIGSLSCKASAVLGLSSPFGAISGGIPLTDEVCERFILSIRLEAQGENDVAKALLAQDERVAQAYKSVGKPIPGQSAKVDTTIPDLKLNTPLGEPKDEKKSESTNFGERTSMTIPEALVANLSAQSIGAGM